MEWNREIVEKTMRELRATEIIPACRNKHSARERIIGAMSVNLFAVDTTLGWMGLAQSTHGIRYLALPTKSRDQAIAALEARYPRGVRNMNPPAVIRKQLIEYAEGQRRIFELEVDLTRMGAFQKSVLTTISNIPFGETRSYSWVAMEIGHPKAARAVGHALATNPIPIIIPCHRVLTSSGELGGYAGGLAMKEALLRLEGAFAVGTR